MVGCSAIKTANNGQGQQQGDRTMGPLTIEENATRAAALVNYLVEITGDRVDNGDVPEHEYVMLRTVQDLINAILHHAR